MRFATKREMQGKQEVGARKEGGGGGDCQGDHGVGERQVTVLQPLQVTQHLVLAVVQVEDGLLQVLAAALEAAQTLAGLRPPQPCSITL